MPRTIAVRVRRQMAVAGLRRWAEGSLTDVAAVELLASCARGRLIDPTCAWVRPCLRRGWYWLDPDRLAAEHGPLTPDQDRTVALVVTLLGGTTQHAESAPIQSVGRWAA